MSYKFNDEDKAEREFTEKLPYGVSKVQLVGVVAGQLDDGREWMDLTVTNEDGVEDVARVWFTDKAAPISFNTLRQIAVHQGKDDKAKEELRQAVENCGDSDELADLLNTKVVGGELWFTKYLDPKRTWTTPEGEVRQSINRNVYGYEPQEKPNLMPHGMSADDRDELNANNLDKIFPPETDKKAEDKKSDDGAAPAVPVKF